MQTKSVMADNECISPFLDALLFISEQLVDDELGKLKYLCHDKLNQNQLETVKEGYKLFELLQKRDMISEKNYSFVIVLLGKINREDLKKKFLQMMGPGDCISPGNLPSSNVNPQVLKTPGHYTHTSPQSGFKPGTVVFVGIPKPVRSHSEDSTSSSGGDQSVRNAKTFMHSSSVPNESPGPTHTIPSVCKSQGNDHSSGSTDRFSSGKLGASGSHVSGIGSDAGQASGGRGRNVEGLMRDLSLRDSTQSDNLRSLPDDVETDSPSLVAEGYRLSSALRSQGRGAQAPIGMNPVADSVKGHSCEMSTPRQDRVPISGPLLKLSSDSPEDTQQSPTPWPLLVDLSTDSPAGDHQLAELRQASPRDVAPAESVRLIDRMMDQREVREKIRASGTERPVLREYQKELAERPLQQFENHIICAPTGSGKTLTAAFICYEYWTWFKSNVSHKHFKALFIVNMRHLTLQQRDAFQKYFPNRQAVRIIADQQTFTDALKIDDPLPAVLMLTAQIFVNALNSKNVDIKDLDMIIFDECHHTDLKHPYNEIMKMYLKKKQRLPKPQLVGVSGAGLPFIIGLSASLGVGSEALGHLLTLCGNMDAKGVVRVLRNEVELGRHVNAPTEDSMKIVSRRADNDQKFGNLLKAIMLQIEDQIPDIETHPLPPHGNQLYEGETRVRLMEAQRLGDRTAVMVYMYLYEYNRALMLYDDLRVVDALKHLEQFHECRQRSGNREQVPTEEHCRRLYESNLREMKQMSQIEDEHSNEKLGELAFLLQQIFNEKHDSKGIILMRMKVGTTAISDFIRKSNLLQALPCRVSPLRFVGQGDIEDDCMSEGEQKTALKSFRDENGCNVLVATDIAQEGLDMPACNFVIRYNFVSNEIGTVQSKGRARAMGSQCFLIVESGSLNERRELENRHKVKKMEEAMEELEAMTENDRLDKITGRQNEILENIRRAEVEAEQQQAMYNLDRITIHCKECSALVCKASELRRKGDGGHVTCISPDFKKWVKEFKYRKPQRYRDTETIGLISCGTVDCGNQFGTIQKFLELHPPDGYAMKAQSFKIHFERGGIKTPKQWKKAGFEIIKDDNN